MRISADSLGLGLQFTKWFDATIAADEKEVHETRSAFERGELEERLVHDAAAIMTR